MTERHKERLIWIVGLVGAVLVLYWLWSRAQAGNSALDQSAASGNPVALGAPIPQISLNFQNPVTAFTNQATGYVPLFGFLGYSGQWQ